jgi:MATE family multidrug resistance protein
MRANITAMVLNVGLNWVLIDGHFGLPALGVRGSALASLLATLIAFLGFLAAFLLHGKKFRAPRLRWSEFGRMLRFGLPSGFNWAFEFFAFVLFINVVVGGLGTVSLAAMMTVFQVNSVSFLPAFGLASAGAILVGQAIGAGRPDRVEKIVRLTVRTAIAWMGPIGLIYWFQPRLLLLPFIPGGELAGAFMAIAPAMLMLSALWQIFDGIGLTYSEALRAAGDTSFPMWARGVIAWGIFLPGAWISVRVLGGGERVAMAWLMAYLGLLAGTLVLRFRNGAWRRIRLVDPVEVRVGS